MCVRAIQTPPRVSRLLLWVGLVCYLTGLILDGEVRKKDFYNSGVEVQGDIIITVGILTDLWLIMYHIFIVRATYHLK